MTKELKEKIDEYYYSDKDYKIVELILGIPEKEWDLEMAGQLIVAYNNTNNYEKAIETSYCYEEKENPAWYYRMAYAYDKLGRHKELVKLIDEAEEVFNQNPEYPQMEEVRQMYKKAKKKSAGKGKRKTLLEDFQAIIDSKDMEAFKKVFDRCMVEATVRTSDRNAFSFDNLTVEHIQYLCDIGLEPDSNCGWNKPAVFFQAGNIENLKCLINNGAHIDFCVSGYYGNALKMAIEGLDEDKIKNLTECGASFEESEGFNITETLEITVRRAPLYKMPQLYRIANLLIENGAQLTNILKRNLSGLGQQFEFRREGMNPELVDECSDALDKLYELLQVMPVPRLKKHDGKSPITVTSTTWQSQYDELWNYLVPAKGVAETVQGEIIRLNGRISHEVLDNGGINWDNDYIMLVKALYGYLDELEWKDENLKSEALKLIAAINRNSTEKIMDRVAELVVGAVIENPMPVKLGKVGYRR